MPQPHSVKAYFSTGVEALPISYYGSPGKDREKGGDCHQADCVHSSPKCNTEEREATPQEEGGKYSLKKKNRRYPSQSVWQRHTKGETYTPEIPTTSP